MTCTRCDGTGYLNTHQIPEEEPRSIDSIEAWMRRMKRDGLAHDVTVCDCCGDGQDWYGEPGEHNAASYYPKNGGIPECA